MLTETLFLSLAALFHALARSLAPPSLSLALSVLSVFLPHDGFTGLGLAVDGQLGWLRRDEPPPEKRLFFFRRGVSVEMRMKREKKAHSRSFRARSTSARWLSSRRERCRRLCSTRPVTLVFE